MSIITKTGLIPIQKKSSFISRKKKDRNNLISGTIAKSVEFSLRPFGGLYNPYSKGCSILCNHPAPSAVRDVIKKVKDSWSSEGRNYWPDNSSEKDNYDVIQSDMPDNIPEELFRRYTDTDSRPLTPSPATTSVRTKNSTGSFLNARRCVTPEPGKDNLNKRKKIILDLRRSHSQETLYWKTSYDITQAIDTSQNLILLNTKVKDFNISKKEDATISQDQDKIKYEQQNAPAICINDRDSEDNELQRRGKKKKRTKSQMNTTTFHLNEDPETQVSALGPDSLNASTRPSLVANPSVSLINATTKRNSTPTQLQGSFLTDEAFRVLKTELDIDVIENTFERYLNRALKEAIKFIVPKSDAVEKQLEYCEENNLFFSTQENMPRKFSKAATRFEMPLSLKMLEGMTTYEYLSKYVWVSRQRKQLYKKVFLKFLLERDDNNTNVSQERYLLSSNFRDALQEVLGFYGTNEIIENIATIVDIDNHYNISFRSWCGIVAFAERFALEDPIETDSCDELEKADFDTTEYQLESLDLSIELSKILKVIRKGHFTNTSRQ